MELEPPVRTLEDVDEAEDVDTELRRLALEPRWKVTLGGEFLFASCLISSELLHFLPRPFLSLGIGEEEEEEDVEDEVENRRCGKEDQEARLNWPSSFFSFFRSR